MTNRFQRPAGAYAGDLTLNNRTKYQNDSTANPKVAISSVKMDGDLNYIINSLNQLNTDISGMALGMLPDDIIQPGKLAPGAVLEESIAEGSVTAVAIAENAVTTAALADDAVTADKIADDAVGANHIADAAVSTDQLADGAVTEAKVADGSITYSKFQNVSGGCLLANINPWSDVVGEISVGSNQLVGRGSLGDLGTIMVGTGLSFTGGTLNSSVCDEFVRTNTLSAAASAIHTLSVGNNYLGDEFLLQCLVPSVDATLQFDVSTDGGATYLAGTNYRYSLHTFTQASDAGVAADGAVFPLAATALVESTGYGASGWVRLQQISSGITTVCGQVYYIDAAAAKRSVTVNGHIMTSAPVTHVRFSFSTGNIASGTIVQRKVRR